MFMRIYASSFFNNLHHSCNSNDQKIVSTMVSMEFGLVDPCVHNTDGITIPKLKEMLSANCTHVKEENLSAFPDGTD